jgi:hypothetical protein
MLSFTFDEFLAQVDKVAIILEKEIKKLKDHELSGTIGSKTRFLNGSRNDKTATADTRETG